MLAVDFSSQHLRSSHGKKENMEAKKDTKNVSWIGSEGEMYADSSPDDSSQDISLDPSAQEMMKKARIKRIAQAKKKTTLSYLFTAKRTPHSLNEEPPLHQIVGLHREKHSKRTDSGLPYFYSCGWNFDDNASDLLISTHHYRELRPNLRYFSAVVAYHLSHYDDMASIALTTTTTSKNTIREPRITATGRIDIIDFLIWMQRDHKVPATTTTTTILDSNDRSRLPSVLVDNNQWSRAEARAWWTARRKPPRRMVSFWIASTKTMCFALLPIRQWIHFPWRYCPCSAPRKMLKTPTKTIPSHRPWSSIFTCYGMLFTVCGEMMIRALRSV